MASVRKTVFSKDCATEFPVTSDLWYLIIYPNLNAQQKGLADLEEMFDLTAVDLDTGLNYVFTVRHRYNGRYIRRDLMQWDTFSRPKNLEPGHVLVFTWDVEGHRLGMRLEADEFGKYVKGLLVFGNSKRGGQQPESSTGANKRQKSEGGIESLKADGNVMTVPVESLNQVLVVKQRRSNDELLIVGWKLPDFMFATKCGLKDAYNSVSNELTKVFHSVEVTKKTISSTLNESSCKYDEIIASTSSAKDKDVTKDGVAKLLLCTLDADNRLNDLIQGLQPNRSLIFASDELWKHLPYQDSVEAQDEVAERMEMKHGLSKALGPLIAKPSLLPIDRFLMFASDGLWEHLTNRDSVQIVYKGPHAEIARKLITKAQEEVAKRMKTKHSLSKVREGETERFGDGVGSSKLSFLNYSKLKDDYLKI